MQTQLQTVTMEQPVGEEVVISLAVEEGVGEVAVVEKMAGKEETLAKYA